MVRVDETTEQPGESTIQATVDYLYDALGRLTREERDSSASGEDYAIDYLLDLASNRLTKTTTKGATVQRVDSQYDARDRLLQEDGFLDDVALYSMAYGYDANGSQTSLVRTGTLPEETTYDFDVRNRLSGMETTRTLADSDLEHLSARYTYNDDGIRVRKTETRALNSSPATTTATAYLIDGATPTGYAQAIEERQTSAVGTSVTPPESSEPPSASYVFGIQLISQARPDGAGDPVASFYLQDSHSGVRQLVAQAAPLDPVPVTDSYTYESFGTLLTEAHLPSGATPNTHLYRAEVWDSGLGLTYLRARYLNSNDGRFVGMDPYEGVLDKPLSFQVFVYAGADPGDNVDPSGEFFLSILAAASIFAAGFAIGALLTPAANYVQTGQSTYDGWWQNGLFGGTAALVSWAIPLVGLGVAGFGVSVSGYSFATTALDPNKTWGQTAVAGAFLGASLFGAWGAYSYARASLAGLTAAEEAALAASIGERIAAVGETISDDALVNFGSTARDFVNPPAGTSYWFRWGDIKAYTSNVIRARIGQLASAEEEGGMAFARVSSLEAAKKPFQRLMFVRGWIVGRC